MERRTFLLTSLMTALAPSTEASEIDPRQTFIEQRNEIQFESSGDVPPGSREMAKLYGDTEKPGPYLVLIRWNLGWFSAPHSYVTDRIQMVVSGTWFVNSGADFTPDEAVPVAAGGFVRRTAHTFHYDGVPSSGTEPTVIAVFGMGPVEMKLANPHQPSWRKV